MNKPAQLFLLLLTLLFYSAKAQHISVQKVVNRYDDKIVFTANTLERASASMYNVGNPRYIWLDLYRDELIEWDADYLITISLTDTAALAGEVPMPAVLTKRYISKWMNFLQQMEEPVKEKYYLNMDAIASFYYDDHFHQGIINFMLSSMKLTRKAENRMIDKMVKDGLAEYGRDFDLYIDDKKLLVNNRQLEGEIEKKYRDIFSAELGFENCATCSHATRASALRPFFSRAAY